MDGGDAGNFDPCECIFSPEMAATRRLMNAIRRQEEQDYCTETNCYDDLIRGEGGEATTALVFIGFWFLVAMVLFFMRPRTNLPTDKRNNGAGPSFDPPAPPSTT